MKLRVLIVAEYFIKEGFDVDTLHLLLWSLFVGPNVKVEVELGNKSDNDEISMRVNVQDLVLI